MQFEVLGALRVLDGDHEVEVTRPAQRRLLTLLLLSFGETVAGSQLVDRFWGSNAPSNAKDTLHVHLVGLRKAIGRSVVETLSTGYRIGETGASVDATEFTLGFTRCLGAFRAEEWEEVLRISGRALAIWRGVPYADLVDNEFARPAIVLLEEQKLQLEEMRLGSLLSLGRNEEAIPVLESLAAEYPLRERIWEYLMLARYRVGRSADALRAYQQIRQTLGEELGVEPAAAMRDLEERILFQDPSLGFRSGHRSPHNLPSAQGSFIGRDDEIGVIGEMLREHRIVTLTGVPGVGKTRLAIESGRRLLDEYPAGTWFVEVAPESSLRQIAASISMTLGVTGPAESLPQLTATISARRGLLIVDGAEDFPEATHALVASFGASTGPLRMLITTRSLSGVGSHIHRVTAFPSVPDAIGVEQALTYGVVQLFVDRARATDRSFSVTEANVEAVTNLCRQLGGNPLAIELAASWADTLDALSINDILEFGESESSLDAGVEMSYRLLQTETQRVFRAMSAFSASFRFADLEAVCSFAADPHLLAGSVAGLVRSSLVETHRAADGTLRYRLLEPIGAYGRLLLEEERHEAGLVATRHAEWCEGLCEDVADQIGTRSESGAFDRLDHYMPDIRRAWEWMLSSDGADNVARTAAGIDRYFFVRFLAWEGRMWIERALRDVSDRDVRAVGLCAYGFLSYIDDDYPMAIESLEKATQLASEVGDVATGAWALSQLARLKTWIRDFEHAHRASSTAMELFERVGEERGIATAKFWFGINELNRSIGRDSGHLEDAVRRLEEIGDLRLVSVGHRMLSDAALGLQNEELARRRSALARIAAEEADDSLAIIGSLVQQSLVEARWGESIAAARLLLEADSHLAGSSELDLNAVLGWPAVPILLRSGHKGLAQEVLANSDRVLSEYGLGLPPVSGAFPDSFGVDLRKIGAGKSARSRSTSDLAEEVRRVLADTGG